MHWIMKAAREAGLHPTGTLPANTPTSEAWEIATRSLGLTARALASLIGPSLRLKTAAMDTADPHVRRLVPERLARRYHVFPLRETDKTITVATANPWDLEAEDSLAFAAGRRVTLELATPHDIDEAINAAYSPDRGISSLLAALTDVAEVDAVRVINDTAPAEIAPRDIEEEPVVRLANHIVRQAVLQNASDVHIEPGPRNTTVRIRVDGVLRHYMHLPTVVAARVISRIKVLARLDITDRMRPQDGRTRMEIGGAAYDLRISTIPTRDAEKVVIRILRPDSASSLRDVGIAPFELNRLRQLIRQRDGIVVVTGPTGSGKTTTLYAAIREIATGEVNVMTVEDPIEYDVPGITQMQVDAKRGLTFATSLRAMLRQDPDVIFVGEIRDLETAEIAVQASMTGHLVLATLHSNDAMGAVARLVDLGLDRAAIAATLRGSLAQRLLRAVCPACAVAGAPTDHERALALQFGVGVGLRATGCAQCGNTGYRGRIPVDEVAVITPAIAEIIERGETAEALQRAAVAGGMRDLRSVALELVAAGRTTLEEVERVIGAAAPDASSTDAPEPSEPWGETVGTAASKAAVHATVLVVDDDPIERLLLEALLNAEGFSVHTAENGAKALECLAFGGNVHRIDLVITDLQMPVMDGATLLARLRASPATTSMPVMVITATTDAEAEARLIDAGADDYVRKPIQALQFIARVRAALRRARIELYVEVTA